MHGLQLVSMWAAATRVHGHLGVEDEVRQHEVVEHPFFSSVYYVLSVVVVLCNPLGKFREKNFLKWGRLPDFPSDGFNVGSVATWIDLHVRPF